MNEYAIRVMALYNILKRLDASNRLEDIATTQAAFASKEDGGKIISGYKRAARDPREVLNLDDDSAMMELRNALNG